MERTRAGAAAVADPEPAAEPAGEGFEELLVGGRPPEDRSFELVEIAAGAATGLAIGTAVAGPVGSLVGGVVGAAAGLAAGEAVERAAGHAAETTDATRPAHPHG